MKPPQTYFVGPLGSEIHRLRADAAAVAAVAGVDWGRLFRRVCLDPARCVITVMAPSPLHERLSLALGQVVDFAGGAMGRTVLWLGGPRLRREDEPEDTGLEPDCAFYFGERAAAYLAAEEEGKTAADEFLWRNGPDLIAEVEMTHADEGKIERYRDLGAREFWRLEGRRDDGGGLRAVFFRLRAGIRPEEIEVSEALPGWTPAEAVEAVGAVRGNRDPKDRRRAVTRIVERRRRRNEGGREERDDDDRRAPVFDGPVSVPCACSLHADEAAVSSADAKWEGS